MQAAEVRTGAMGFGNKGAVMVRMRVYGEPICCLCMHLASGETPADALRRQADFLHICRTGTFSDAPADGAPGHVSFPAPLDADVMCAPQTQMLRLRPFNVMCAAPLQRLVPHSRASTAAAAESEMHAWCAATAPTRTAVPWLPLQPRARALYSATLETVTRSPWQPQSTGTWGACRHESVLQHLVQDSTAPMARSPYGVRMCHILHIVRAGAVLGSGRPWRASSPQ